MCSDCLDRLPVGEIPPKSAVGGETEGRREISGWQLGIRVAANLFRGTRACAAYLQHMALIFLACLKTCKNRTTIESSFWS